MADVAQEVVQKHIRLCSCRGAWSPGERSIPGRPLFQHHDWGLQTVSLKSFFYFYNVDVTEKILFIYNTNAQSSEQLYII